MHTLRTWAARTAAVAGLLMSAADLALSRAGAGTLA